MIGGCAALVCLSLISMGFDRHSIHPLMPVQAELLPPLSLKESKVIISAHVMDGDESKRVFGHDLPSRGIYPLEVSIQNNTADLFSLSASSIDLPRVEASAIARRITRSAIPRSIALKIASFFFWPLAIPSTIDGVRVYIHHRQIKKDVTAKSLKDETLASYSTLHRVLFVKKEDLPSQFKMTLIELENLQATEFQVETKGASPETS